MSNVEETGMISLGGSGVEANFCHSALMVIRATHVGKWKVRACGSNLVSGLESQTNLSSILQVGDPNIEYIFLNRC